MAFAKDGDFLFNDWFKHPHPVAERSWYEISSDHFAAPLLMPSSEEKETENNPVGTPPIDTQPSTGGSGKELRKLGERCQERIIQAAQLAALSAAKNICKNGREKNVLEDLKNREFSTAIDKLEIESEAKKARKVFCETYLSVMSNVLKQGGCIVISAGYINPLTTRYIIEFSISLIDSEANTRREQLTEAVSNGTMNMIAPLVDGVVCGMKGERWVRGAANIILDQTPEEAIENLVKDPVKKIAKNVIDFIPENNFLDKPVENESNNTWYWWKDSSPAVSLRYYSEQALETNVMIGFMINAVVTSPVYFLGEEELYKKSLDKYMDFSEKLIGFFHPPVLNMFNHLSK